MSIKTDFSGRTLKYQELLDRFKKILKDSSLKFTIQRELILEALYESQMHLTPENLHALMQNENGDINIGIATIYRTLSLLEESGLVTSISFGSAGKKYELGAKQHHDHFICIKCGTIIEFVDDSIEKRQEEIAQKLNFEIHDHSMQIFGECEKCNKDKR